MKNKSIIIRVLVINMCIALAVIIFVVFNNVFMISKIRRQNEEKICNEIHIIQKKIYEEFQRIKNTEATLLSFDNSEKFYTKVSQIRKSINLLSVSYPYNISMNVFLDDGKTAVNNEGTYGHNVFGVILYRKYGEYPEKCRIEEIEVFNDYILVNYDTKGNGNGSASAVIAKEDFAQYIFNQDDAVKYDIIFSTGEVMLSNLSEKEKHGNYYTYEVKDNNFMGEQIIAYIPKSELNKDLYSMNWYTGIIILMFTVLNSLAAFMQYKIYFPIKK